jgi:protein-tyrosine phosphatase
MNSPENKRIHKRLKHLPDISSLAVDIHSHLIPGIDDGAKTIEDSVKLIRQLHGLGYKKLITTPHVNFKYPNNPAVISEGLAKLREALSFAGIDIAIEAAAEYKLHDDFASHIKPGDLLTFGDNFLLIELDYHFLNPMFSSIIYDLQSAGYTVVLAHAERYTYWHRNLKEFAALKDRGVMLQVNFMSLSIFNPVSTRKTARMLIDANMVDFAGTDLHNDMYMKLMLRGMRSKHAFRMLASGKLKNASLL